MDLYHILYNRRKSHCNITIIIPLIGLFFQYHFEMPLDICSRPSVREKVPTLAPTSKWKRG